jgi:hypothetical protein
MAYRAPVIDTVDRDRRQQRYANAPAIAERFPKAGAFAIDMRFEDPAGSQKPATFRQIYLPQMQAYFDVRCPLPECSGGGFDLDSAVASALGRAGHGASGTAQCAGARSGPDGRQRCDLLLHYTVSAAD